VQGKQDELGDPEYVMALDTWDDLWQELQAVLAVAAQAACFSLTDAASLIESEVMVPLMTLFRDKAYRMCFGEDGTHVLGIAENQNLASLDGLTSLVDGSIRLVVTGNPSLTDVSALGNLANADLELEFVDLPQLASLSGLQDLTMEKLTISQCDGMQSLGLSNCTVTEDIFLWFNESLVGVDGLQGTTALAGGLRIEGNAAFTDLGGLAGLVSVGGNLTIQTNGSLDNCVAESFAEGISVGGFTTIGANGPCDEERAGHAIDDDPSV